jgi:hypothetical protein
LEDFSPSDLDYNINYTDPSYSEQNMGRWKLNDYEVDAHVWLERT